ncbi:MAG: glycerate kinase [Chitinophagaceae bacterium]
MTTTIIIATDKFKGSLTSFEAAAAIANGLKTHAVSDTIISFPFADGGDGFAAVMKYYLQTQTISCLAADPLGRPIEASYEWDAGSKTAIIEMAVTSGLVLLKKEEQDPLQTSTYGTGLMIRHAIGKGAKKIILGLGGSATTDAGTGILAAMNFQFTNDKNELLQPSGENLLHIKSILPPAERPPVQFEIACDVQNILYGRQGAAQIYAAQKGAGKKAIILLDNGLQHFSATMEMHTGRKIAAIPGTGAAGGVAAGLMGYFDVTLSKGVELVAAASKIEDALPHAGLLITGEGRIDAQSNEGKVTGFIGSLAKQYKLPCTAFCGVSTLDAATAAGMGIQKIITLASNSGEIAYALNNAAAVLEKKAAQLFL